MTKKVAKKRAVKAKPLEDDERFNEITKNPLFQEMRRKDRKVTVDKRFKEMFTDQQFGIGRTKTDVRGRPLAKDQRKDVKSLYDLSESEDEDKSEKEEESDGEIRIDLARGSGNIYSSDEDSESGTDSEVEREDGQNEVIWDKLQTGIRHVEWASKRLAICNMDWDHVKGEDLLLLLQSFKPASGEVKAVSIYLSDFGAERLEAEEREGPKMAIKKANAAKKVADGQEIDEETRSAIRSYQFDRMRYYYAVVDCDTVETASSIYEACDRVEYESSGVQLDLRFIPDETNFDESRLRECVTIDNINVNKYKANYFETAAIRFQNPKVTWDETNPDRLKKVDRIMKKDNPDEDVSDLEDLIAPGSDEEASDEEHDGDGKNALKELFAAAGIERDDKKKSSMVVDWEPVTTTFSDAAESDEDEEEMEENKQQKKKKKQTPFQEYLERRKVEKKKRKVLIKERKQKAKEEDAENRREIEANISAAKRRPKKSELATNLTADITDQRFDALFSNTDFAIDKTSLNFKGGALADTQVKVKHDRLRKRKNADTVTASDDTAAAPPSNEDLIKKLKAKSNKLRKT